MPHQKQIGVGFLSLQVEIPVFWLGGRRNPQKGKSSGDLVHNNVNILNITNILKKKA
jgi:hypothetical protein